ncbi:hypothetical protein A9Q97_06460 [Rhodospirillales bacterium 47_12_T64]|nr:hypothetical protein A9Q97_06460 [Rhodospirillales bacterium 47_12_T64]
MTKKALSSTLLVILLFLPFAQVTAKTFIISPDTAEATFTGQLLGLTSFNGQFHDISGKILSDPDNPERDMVQISISACSIEMPNQFMSAKAKSSSFLDCARYPRISFFSTRAQWQHGNNLRINGLLTVHGITREIQLTTKSRKHDVYSDKPLSFQGEISISRLDFGVGSRFSAIDDEITISFDIIALEEGTLTASLK